MKLQQLTSLVFVFLLLALNRCATAQVVALNVAADQVAYQPGDQVKLSVEARHAEANEIKGKLAVDIYCDANTRFLVCNESVTIAPGKTFRRSFEWTAPNDELWGCHIDVRFLHEGKALANDRQVFVVSDNLVKTAANLAYISPGYFKTGQQDPVAYAYDKFHDMAIPMLHVSCWTPSNWGEIFPTTGSWICGQMRYRVSMDDLDLMVGHAKRRGMFTVTYGRITLDGPAGYRWAKANPDKVWYRKPDGQLKPFSGEELQHWDTANSSAKASIAELRKLKRWSMVPKLNDNQVLDNGINQYLKAIKRFGFDAIRWDWHPGYYYHPHTNWLLQIGSSGNVHAKYYDRTGKLDIVDDPDAENLRIIRRWKRQMLASKPDLKLGYNLQVMNSVHPDNEEINPPPMRAYSEMIRNAFIIDEKHFVNLAPGRTAGMHQSWAKTLKFWSKGSERVRRYGGYHYTGGHPNFGADAFIQHAYSLSYACGARATAVAAPNVKHKPWYGELVSFAQRYSMYLFHPSMHPLVVDEGSNGFPNRLSVQTLRPVVWKPFSHTITDRGQFTVVAQLWNKPLKESMNVNKCESPPPVKKATVKFTQPRDVPHDKAKAYALSYEWPGWIRPIEINSTSSDVTVELPTFQYWAVVLLQYPIRDK